MMLNPAARVACAMVMNGTQAWVVDNMARRALQRW
jgi:hypothetical protein